MYLGKIIHLETIPQNGKGTANREFSEELGYKINTHIHAHTQYSSYIQPLDISSLY